MRLWNRNAAEQNDPNYTVPPGPGFMSSGPREIVSGRDAKLFGKRLLESAEAGVPHGHGRLGHIHAAGKHPVRGLFPRASGEGISAWTTPASSENRRLR